MSSRRPTKRAARAAARARDLHSAAAPLRPRNTAGGWRGERTPTGPTPTDSVPNVVSGQQPAGARRGRAHAKPSRGSRARALATAEPKKLRYRLLHVAARITRTARRTRLAIAASWPWTDALTSPFDRLAAMPRPAG